MLKTNIAQLAIHHPQHQGVLKVFISSNDKQSGQILIMAGINAEIEGGKEIIKKIINEIKYNYFNIPSDDIENILESTLQKTNFLISQIVKEQRENWLEKLNMVIIALKHPEIHFAKVGQMRAFLIGPKSIADIAGDNILSNAVNPIKTFENILSGEVPDKQAVIFLSETVLDYISQEKIKKTINENKAKQAIKELEKLLKSAPHHIAFSSILLKNEDDEEKIIKEETKTEAKPKITKPQQEKEFSNLTETKPGNKKKNKPQKSLKEEALKIIESTKEDALIDIPERKKKLHRSSLANSKLSRSFQKFSNLSLLNKILIILIVVITVVLIMNMSEKEKLIVEEKKQDQFSLLIGQIEQKQGQAEITAINDTVAARNILLELKSLIQELPTKTAEQSALKQELLETSDRNIILTYNINIIDNPRLLSDFAELNKDADLQQIILKDSQLYTVNSKNNAVYTLNPADSKPLDFMATSQDTAVISQILGDLNNELFFFEENQGMAKLDLKTKKITNFKLDYQLTAQPAAATLYQNKLYFTLPSENKIIKLRKTLTSFANSSSWLSDSSVNLANAVDMAIDGNIWILKSNGKILKLFKGKNEEFNFSVEPALTETTSFYTGLEIANIYLIDKGTKRVLVLDKAGNLKQQFMSDMFDDLKDVIADEDRAEIYVLNGTKVYVLKM